METRKQKNKTGGRGKVKTTQKWGVKQGVRARSGYGGEDI